MIRLLPDVEVVLLLLLSTPLLNKLFLQVPQINIAVTDRQTKSRTRLLYTIHHCRHHLADNTNVLHHRIRLKSPTYRSSLLSTVIQIFIMCQGFYGFVLRPWFEVSSLTPVAYEQRVLYERSQDTPLILYTPRCYEHWRRWRTGYEELFSKTL